MIVLDTDLMSLSQSSQSTEAQKLRERIDRIPVDEQLAVTIVSYEEQTRGWLAYMAKAKTSSLLMHAYHRLYDHLVAYRSLYIAEFDLRSSFHYDRLRSQRIRIGTMDLRIAAIVLANNALLVSRNLVHFRQVPNLRVEDWTQ